MVRFPCGSAMGSRTKRYETVARDSERPFKPLGRLLHHYPVPGIGDRVDFFSVTVDLVSCGGGLILPHKCTSWCEIYRRYQHLALWDGVINLEIGNLNTCAPAKTASPIQRIHGTRLWARPVVHFLPIRPHGFPSQSLNSSRVMTSRSHFFFISLACSLQA